MALIAFAFSSFNAEALDCRDEFFRVSRIPGNCQNFFVCMIGRRVDFSCDEGDIFDEDRVACRRGDAETCDFFIPQIPEDACDNQFFQISPHPDPEQCSSFFVCMNNNLVIFRCSAGYIFSAHAQVCVPGNQRTCREDEATPYIEAEASKFINLMTNFGER